MSNQKRVKLMLKPQDIVILVKILSIMTLPEQERSELLSQHKLALHLCISASEVNAGIKRLLQSRLLVEMSIDKNASHSIKRRVFIPVQAACEECLILGVKYFFPARLGAYSRGIATSYAAPSFEKKIILGQDPIPIWPYGEGDQRGLAIEPLYSSVPKAITQYPDKVFYDMLTLIDAIRTGRARERNIAIQLLKEKIYYES